MKSSENIRCLDCSVTHEASEIPALIHKRHEKHGRVLVWKQKEEEEEVGEGCFL